MAQASEYLQQQIFDLLLLDISLPDGNGIAFAKQLQRKTRILFVSAIDDEQTIVDSFQLGSEDYITKPFRLPILLARVQAIIKRYALDKPIRQQLGHLFVDTQEHRVFHGNDEIIFTKNEHRLFFYLYNHIGQILTREQLLDTLWDSQGDFVNDNTLTVTLKRLRQKIELEDRLIETKRGIGYRLKNINEVSQ